VEKLTLRLACILSDLFFGINNRRERLPLENVQSAFYQRACLPASHLGLQPDCRGERRQQRAAYFVCFVCVVLYFIKQGIASGAQLSPISHHAHSSCSCLKPLYTHYFFIHALNNSVTFAHRVEHGANTWCFWPLVMARRQPSKKLYNTHSI
jgi:hypothetical protein